MTAIPRSDDSSRNARNETSFAHPLMMFTCWPMNIGGVIYISLLASLSCGADIKDASKIGRPPAPRRTWAEVQAEINFAFDACEEGIQTVQDSLPLDLISIGVRGGASLRPTTSVLDLKVDRHPSGRPREVVIILDIRVERDYSIETGQASSFRIVCNSVRDEGQEMVAEMVSFFEKKKWPYEIIDPKNKEKPDVRNSKGELGKKSSP